MNSKLTQLAFKAGAIYFICMAIAHFFGIKVPVLFIYYDVPFYAYQDKIISFAVCAYVALFYLASSYRPVALSAILVMGITVTGLCAVNSSTALSSVLQPGQSTQPYWIQTGAIFLYLVALIALYIKDARDA